MKEPTLERNHFCARFVKYRFQICLTYKFMLESILNRNYSNATYARKISHAVLFCIVTEEGILKNPNIPAQK